VAPPHPQEGKQRERQVQQPNPDSGGGAFDLAHCLGNPMPTSWTQAIGRKPMRRAVDCGTVPPLPRSAVVLSRSAKGLVVRLGDGSNRGLAGLPTQFGSPTIRERLWIWANLVEAARRSSARRMSVFR
jgi:hypothetical protein